MKTKELMQRLPKGKLILLLIFKMCLSAFNVFFSWMMQIGLESVLDGFVTQKWLAASLGMIGGAISYILVDYFFKITLKQMFHALTNSLSEVFIKNCLSYREILSNMNEGRLLAIFADDLDIIGNYIEFGLIPLLDMGITLIFGVLYVAIQSWQFGILFMGIALGIFFVNRKLSFVLEDDFSVYLAENDRFIQFVEQVYHFIPSIKVFGVNKWIYEKYVRYASNRKESFNKYNTNYANIYTVTEGMIKLMDVLVLVIGLIFVSKKWLTLPMLIGIRNAGLGSILYPAGSLPNLFRYYGQYHVSLERLNIYSFECVDAPLEEIKFPNPVTQPISIQLKQVNLSKDRIIEGTEAVIHPTGVTFIVGPSGSGKSTLIKILMGMFDDFNGQLLYGTQNFQPSLYRFGYAPQKNVLFRASLRQNLSLGNEAISDKEIEEICQKLDIWSLITSKSGGLDNLYEPGNEWSNGQMRRLNIARTLLLPSDILILDEPFSDLDLENQDKVMTLIRKMSHTKPVLIITHTFDFVQSEDHVIKVGGNHVEA
ncbi:MAG: ABC transporter ATP-binding protein [Aerococcaceae bacterium]|nr:ABC transporter ATP-binding protein [Aerococcaceae bacterium]